MSWVNHGRTRLPVGTVPITDESVNEPIRYMAEATGMAPWASFRRVHTFMLMMTAAISACWPSLKMTMSASSVLMTMH